MKALGPVKLILVVVIFISLMTRVTLVSFSSQGNNDWDKRDNDSHKNDKDDKKDDKDRNDKDKDKNKHNDKDGKDKDESDREENQCKDDEQEEPEEEEPTEEPEEPVDEEPEEEPEEEQPTEEPKEEEPTIEPSKNADLKIDKKIYNPSSKNYESNINKSGGSHPYVFDSYDTVKFEIKISNIGEVEIKDIKVKDYMPEDLDYDGGDGDKKDGNKVEFGSFSLKPGEDKEFNFSADIERVNTDTGTICTTNVVKASGTRVDTDQAETSEDDSAFCYEVEPAQGGSVLGDSDNGKVLGKEAPGSMPVTGFPLIPAIFNGMSGMGMALIGAGLKGLSRNNKQ